MPVAESKPARIVVIGGVAAGATAAAKARREHETAQIIILERGPYVSFATCGLPFHISGEVHHRSALLLQSPETLFERYNLDVRLGHEVIAIDRAKRTVTVRLTDHAVESLTESSRSESPDPQMTPGTTFAIAWDKLILAMGGSPNRVELPGIDPERCFNLWTMQDMDRIQAFIRQEKPKNAVVLGGSYLGLEAAEALLKRGIKVKLVEQAPTPMPSLDQEFAYKLRELIEDAGVEVLTSAKALSYSAKQRTLEVQAAPANGAGLAADNPRSLPAELVILAAGTHPNTGLALACGLERGASGGLLVNRYLQSSLDPDIYVAGDIAEVPLRPDKLAVRLPLAGPANRQGRVAGANAARSLLADKPAPLLYPGCAGTSILRFQKFAVASTGLSERGALAAGLPAAAVVVHRSDRASYVEGARLLSVKLVYNQDTGTILGAQAIGEEGVDKRIDVLATALQAGMGVRQLAELDLSYAPPFNSANDPVNFAGMVADNNLSGFAPAVSPAGFLRQFDLHQDGVLDVRQPSEHDNGAIPGSLNIPLDELRPRLSEVPRDKRVLYVHCAVGYRAHLAVRILLQAGIASVVNISGGWASLRHFFPLDSRQTRH